MYSTLHLVGSISFTPPPHSSAFLCMMKMLKLLLVSSAYACIMQVVYTMKKDPQSVTTERRSAVTQLQSALEQIIPASEVKLKSTSMSLAKDYFKKVSLRWCNF